MIVVGPHLLVLKASSLFCTQGSHLEVLGGPYGLWGLNLGWSHAEQSLYLLYYYSIPGNFYGVIITPHSPWGRAILGKDKMRCLSFSNFSVYYKSVVIQTMLFWNKAWWVELNVYGIYGPLIFDEKEQKVWSGARKSSSIDGIEKNWCVICKNWAHFFI